MTHYCFAFRAETLDDDYYNHYLLFNIFQLNFDLNMLLLQIGTDVSVLPNLMLKMFYGYCLLEGCITTTEYYAR